MTLESPGLDTASLTVEEEQEDAGCSGQELQTLDHSSMAKSRLEVVEEQLTNKLQAFQVELNGFVFYDLD